MRKCLKVEALEVSVLCLFIAIFSLSLHSCGGTFREYPNQGDVSGTWDLSLNQSNVTVRSTKLFITQAERYQPFSGNTSDNATLSGTLNGDNIVIALHNSDGSVTTLNGTVINNGINGWNEFSGTYTSTGSNGSGTWSATKEVPISTTISATPSSATLSCSSGQSATFTVTGGTLASYSVSASSNGSLVALSTSTLTTNGQFTVTALTTCASTNGTIVSLIVSDTLTAVTVPVTISNP